MIATRRGPPRPIDWEDVRARLARAGAVSRENPHLSPEAARDIMDERARVLARVPNLPPGASEVLEVAIFALGNERYAIETRHIRKIVQLKDLTSVPGAADLLSSVITPIPGAPSFVVGVINLRGEVLAVFDLRSFLGVTGSDITVRTRLVVLGDQHDEFGVLVDAAHEVRMLRIDEVIEPPGSITGFGRQYIQGVTPNALIVLNGLALLLDSRLIIDQGDETGDSPAG